MRPSELISLYKVINRITNTISGFLVIVFIAPKKDYTFIRVTDRPK